ncbi:molybdenum cofactor guanylyltransferase MobA [Oricola cellulosilytica]|uniref:Molybdenum cofactor guanylyltransferase n=1 Tax=Oricola cellulosilytica TaxID=1429082 RepID=A0A4R0P564_9HYPH|nr:molybdenum cofactor guanylyltransferase MobA [Oricola cellulosilytica]TCD11817.1 molybdenum cofactor guanylyltransferase MobA [Oricola cellulosilytica]
MVDRHGVRVVGVILAGGLSRRMGGGDKPLMDLGGRPMLQHVIARLEPQVEAIAINANGDPKRFAEFGKPVVEDTVEGHAGPLAGILSGMLWAHRLDTGVTHVLTAAADTPFLPPDLAARLTEEATGQTTIAMAESDGHRHPVFALWPVALASDLQAWMAATDTYKVMAWARRHTLIMCNFALLSDGTDPFFNANTPEELARAEAILQKAA